MKLKKVIAWGLALTMTLSLDVPSVNAADDVANAPLTKEQQIALAKGDGSTPGQLPGTNRTFFDEDSDIRDWFNISGYVADSVQDRSEYYEEYVANGRKNTANYIVVEEDGAFEKTTGEYITKAEYEALSEDEQKNYRYMTAEGQFMNALGRGAKVIQVNAEELELGFHYLEENDIDAFAISAVTDYTKGGSDGPFPPQTNPIIMHKDDKRNAKEQGATLDVKGTGISDLSLYSHLTLFSTSGCVIRHAGFDLGGCEDVIIRNFRMEGMYEWDDYYAAEKKDFTTRKRYGWCNVSLNDSDNIWIDHCTFGFAFDGNLDLKNGSSVSVTWCQFGVQDFSTNDEEKLPELPKWYESNGSELWKSILYMEELYQNWVEAGKPQNQPRFQEYTKYRENGAKPEELLRYAAMHSKVHLCGSGEDSFYTNVDEKITLGFNYYTNVIQRMPLIRQGNGHMFNCIVDNTEFTANSKALNAKGVGVGYSYSVSVNNPRDGASIGSDTCIFRDVDPSVGSDTQGMDLGNVNEDWKEIFAPTVNHSLIVNSQIIKTTEASGEEVDYTGSSWDQVTGYGNKDGDNPFTKRWQWDDANNRPTIGDFKWSKWKNQDVFAEFSNITHKLEGLKGKLFQYGSGYYDDFYEGSYELGYDYQCFELDKVEKMLAEYGGAGEDIYGEDWSPLDYIQPYNTAVMEKTYKKKVILNLGGATAEKKNNTYYLKDGESVALPTVEELKNENEGYEFLGWKKGSYNAEGKLELSEEFLANPDEAVTITAGDAYVEEYYYAIWGLKTYEVTFDSLGGSAVEDILTIKHYQMISEAGGFPADPTREGYTFNGWYRDYNPKTQKYGPKVRNNTVLNASMTLYAKWDNIVTFETNGGSIINPVSVESGKKVSVAAPTKEGAVFLGWFKDEECTEPFDMKTETITEPITLYAGWEGGSEPTYTVTFETNGGNAIAPVEVESGKKVSVAAPTKEGYIFTGWFKDEGCTEPFDVQTETITGAMTLYAGWRSESEPTYTVTFETNGGSAIAPVEVGSGEKVSVAAPTKEGYIFTGWFKDEECTEPFDVQTETITGAMTLYAGWRSESAPTYTVTFETNGGSAIAPVEVGSGEKVSVAAPTKEGYIFTGWFKDEGCTEPFDVQTETITGAMTLYAGWRSESVPTYTVTFETNGGSTIAPVEVGSGEKVSVANPTKEGCIFKGWFKDEECTEPFDVQTETITGATTLYAGWGLLGDVNNDGQIDSGDALAVLKHDVNIAQDVFVEEAADVNGDEKIDSGDALDILKYDVQLIESFSAGQNKAIVLQQTAGAVTYAIKEYKGFQRIYCGKLLYCAGLQGAKVQMAGILWK